MMRIQDRYRWEAELTDGRIVTEGELLHQAVRLSLIPSEGSGLPRHDLVGVCMYRRFGRGFIRGLGGGLREYVHCVVCKSCRFYVRCSDGCVLVTPEDYELYL